MLMSFKRPIDLPMEARVMREARGKYVVMITFKQSKRHYSDEYVFAKNIKDVKAHVLKLYPTMQWRKSR